MTITIKKTAEFEKALAIAKTLPEFFTQQGLNEIKKQLPDQMVYGAYDGEELIGCVSYKKINRQTIDIAWLFILEKYQGKGIGTELVEKTLAEEGQEFAVCQVNTLAETVEDAGYALTRKFYEKLGFVPIEIIDPYPGWGPGNPCQIYVKCLK
jgi:GNAT superfamily N-acetyltransferase